MTNLQFQLQVKKEKSSLTYQQKAFNRLIKTVEDLQRKQEKTNQELEFALQFYHEAMKPKEMSYLKLKEEHCKKAYQFYVTSKELDDGERAFFKDWLLGQVSNICTSLDNLQLPSTDLKAIHTKLSGIDYQQNINRQIEAEKNAFQERLKAAGINIDISDIDAQASVEEIMRSLHQKMENAGIDSREAFENFENKKVPKTKKQLEKESKQKAFQEMQAKSLGNIYKQLVRVLHPDLEQDPQQRAWKEELMKKLTIAYENSDLFSLLSIEMEWMNRSANKTQAQHDQDLKIYNSILKDQIRELEETISSLIMHPRYAMILHLFPAGFTGTSSLQKKYKELQDAVSYGEKLVLDMAIAKNATKIFKEFIRDQRETQILSEEQILERLFKQDMCDCGDC